MKDLLRSRLKLALIAFVALAAVASPMALSVVSAHSATSVKYNFAATGNLDCNGFSNIQKPLRIQNICTDFKGYDNGRGFDNGHYIGHDEPTVQFVSSASGSGNNTKWEITLRCAIRILIRRIPVFQIATTITAALSILRPPDLLFWKCSSILPVSHRSSQRSAVIVHTGAPRCISTAWSARWGSHSAILVVLSRPILPSFRWTVFQPALQDPPARRMPRSLRMRRHC